MHPEDLLRISSARVVPELPPYPAPGTYKVKGSGTFWAGVGVTLARRGSLAWRDRRETGGTLCPKAEACPDPLHDTYLSGGLFKERGGG